MHNFFTTTHAAYALAACLAAGVLTGCAARPAAPAEEDNRPVIVVGTDTYPPYNYLSEDGTPTGSDVELAEEAFGRMGYRVEFDFIDWENKNQLLENSDIDCIWDCFTMTGREDDYRWAGPYMASSQVVAVMPSSPIQTLADLEGCTLAVQTTTKPEQLFLSGDARLPALRDLYSFEDRELLYTALGKGYVDAIAAHKTSILQYMQDYGTEYRILDEPLQTVGLGVAFSKNDPRRLDLALNEVLEEMRRDGTTAEILGRYFPDPAACMEVDGLVQ